MSGQYYLDEAGYIVSPLEVDSSIGPARTSETSSRDKSVPRANAAFGRSKPKHQPAVTPSTSVAKARVPGKKEEPSMAPSPSLTTSTAFDLLRDEIDARLAKFHAAISDASAKHAYDQVSQLAKAAQEVADLKKELAALEKRFGVLVETDGSGATRGRWQEIQEGIENAGVGLSPPHPTGARRSGRVERVARGAESRLRDDEGHIE